MERKKQSVVIAGGGSTYTAGIVMIRNVRRLLPKLAK